VRAVVLQSNYLPWRGYFHLIHDADHFVFYDEVKYTKNDWRNRNRIVTKNRPQWFTIPISKTAVHQKISEVSLPDGWQEDHFKVLLLAYKRAPFFNQLEPLIFDFYKARKWETLSSFNQYAIRSISRLLNIQTKFSDSSSYTLEGDRVDRLVNLLMQVGATHYLSGPSAANYLTGKEHLFEEKNITLEYKKYPVYKEYKQNFSPFQPSVSIVDLIAHVHLEDIAGYIWDNH
jgi:WbqC-like protein family